MFYSGQVRINLRCALVATAGIKFTCRTTVGGDSIMSRELRRIIM